MVPKTPLILVVDDESDSLAYLFDLLHNEGYRVLPTASSLDALEQVVKKHPQVIISDLRMPDLDGLELLERVKAISPGTKVILLTACADGRIGQEILKKGGDGMLLKPLKNEEILQAVKQALEGMKQCSL